MCIVVNSQQEDVEEMEEGLTEEVRTQSSRNI
jgi:hypothetical protein